MRIGILCAGDREVKPFLPLLVEERCTQKAMLQVYEGRIAGVKVAVLYSGVCKVNAAVAAQILIDAFHCTAIINAGTAGGMAREVELFDTIVCTEAAYHDVAEHILTDFHPWMPSAFFPSDQKLLAAARQAAGSFEGRVRFGRMITGEQFITNEKRDELNARFAPLSVDMETAAVAHVCYVNQIPFLAVRCITDAADHSAPGAFEINCEEASQRSACFVWKMLQTIN